MSTCYDAEATALALLDYTTPSDYELSSDWAEAWSSSPLGDPTVDDEDFFDHIDEHGPQALAPRPTSGVAIAAAVLGALGVGALLSVAVLDFTSSPTPTQTVVVPGATHVPGPATPQAAAPTAAVPAPAPAQAPAPAPAASRGAAPVTNHLVIPSGSGAPANVPLAGSDAGPAAVDVPVDAGPPPQNPHPSVILNVPPVPQVPAVPQLPGVPPVPAVPPVPPVPSLPLALPMPKFLPPPPPPPIVKLLPCDPQPFCI